MNSRERMLAAIDHKETDRIPILAHFTPEIAEQLSKRLGIPAVRIEALMPVRVSYNEILLHLGNDAVSVGPGADRNFKVTRYENGEFDDEWGFRYKKVGKYIEIVHRPLASVTSESDILSFRLPSPESPGRWDSAEEYISRYGDEYAVFGFLPNIMFELSWNLIGLEKYLMDFYSKEPYVITLLDRLLEYGMECGRKLVEMGTDVLWVGDDVGAQDNMLISPELWRDLLKPRMKVFFSTMKKLNPDLKLIYHSCGSIRPIIPDLIEIGLDILNPLQPLARDMDIKELKDEFGKDLAFCGGIDVQEILPTGTVEEVAAHVRDRIEKASINGGYIAAPAHVIQCDTPVENVLAFFDAVRKYK